MNLKEMNLKDWLSTTTAGEIMVREVTVLKHSESLARAAETLLREQITGAPVVNDTRACIGVLSASDVLGAEERVAADREKEAESSLWHSNLALPMSVYEARLAAVRDKLAPAAEQPVERFMTSDIVSVEGTAPLHDVVRKMVDAHIHRVVVLDDQRRLLGIISTTDVLAAMLRAAGSVASP